MFFFKKRNSYNVDKKVLNECIRYLEENPHIEPEHGQYYTEQLLTAVSLLPSDYEYAEHHEKIQNAGLEPESYSLEQIRTMLTFYLRGERFCDGFILETANTGELLRVLKRLKQLTDA